MDQLGKIRPSNARYIKLGEGGAWEEICLKDGTLRLGYYEVPHEVGLSGDKAAIRDLYLSVHKAGTATRHATQVHDFYSLGEDTIWITFSAGCLWWCFARTDIEYLGADSQQYPHGSRFRRAINGWHNTSVTGKPLRISELHGALTATGGYRQTICALKDHAFEYLVRKINDEPIPAVATAQNAHYVLLESMQSLLELLYWPDFELLVDLVFSHSGWQRMSVVGTGLKTMDIELRLPSTGERAMVQVKSSTSQNQLDEYVSLFESWEIDRLFYVYHTGGAALRCDNPKVTLIGPQQLPSMVLNAGLAEWLLKKVS